MKPLSSWGNYPDLPQQASICHWRDQISGKLQTLQREHGSTLAFGNGRSYGDSCLAQSNHVLHLRALDRFIHFDNKSGVLRAEAGATLADIINACLPQGWFLPVTPGTRFVTLGGAVANDVHGKNHHVRGSFGRHLRGFSLCRSDQPAPVFCSATENAELFAATIGGLGLTGIIEWVELQLQPVRSAWLDVSSQRFDNLSEFFQLSAELDPGHEYAVAWVDCLAKGRQRGRGIYSAANHRKDDDFFVADTSRLRVPCTPPVSLINKLSLHAFNSAYFFRHSAQPICRRQHYAPFFYPLDGILNWNRLYGRSGFQQFQCVIPEDNAQAAVDELLDTIARQGQGSFLAVLKRCGDLASPGLLSFPLAGTSLALDFPQQSGTIDLLRRLDSITQAAQGRLYPAKDAHMQGKDFRQQYPRWESLERLRDPALCSHFWKRVTCP